MRAMLYPLLIVALAAPAAAQEFNVLGAANMKHKTQEDADAEKQRNDDYKASLQKMPDQNVKSDPWGNMRGGGAQTGQKKQAAPKQATQKQADQKQKQTGAQ
ncbi:MAG TPA: hypothetical protein VLX44_20640 [Xanthobacteraceae bacterium]|nr:hypothetical protein [Xanthobacteraceae bacterium]